MEKLIHQIPKTELHLHIEGTLEPELMFTLAERNKVKLPYQSVDDIRRAYQFTNLQSFLDIYYSACNVLIKEKDFYDLTWAYLIKASEQNIRHVEIFFDPQTHTQRGINFETIITGIYQALLDGKEQLNITGNIIMCFLRDLSAEEAMETLSKALPYKHMLIAVGLDSAEVGHPPEKFKKVFTRARAEGLLTVAHAGEEGPPEYILQAINLLKVKRIDHGVRCLEDAILIDYLKESQLPLTVCPLSNIKLHVFDTLEQHPLKKMLELGLCATINSDDPSYFGGYLEEHYMASQKALQLTRDEIFRLAQNGIQASFLSQREKQILFDELNQLKKQ